MLDFLPPELVYFIIVAISSLLIGLSQRRVSLSKRAILYFGSDRTFTLIGVLGFLLYTLDRTKVLFGGGGIALILFLCVSYYFKIQQQKSYGMTAMLIALITYCLGPIAMTQPFWMLILVVVTTLLLTEMKETFTNFAKKLNENEFITLAKFLFISGIVLPILPNEKIVPEISLTPYSVWLATVVVSTISYVGYLLKRFVFKGSGIIMSGILGGLYSSTATIVILGKKAKAAPEALTPQYAAAILLAIGMMYVRVFVFTFIFSSELFRSMTTYFVVMIAISCLSGLAIYFRKKRISSEGQGIKEEEDKNPLEFKVALIFALLFVAFTLITHYVVTYFGESGLSALSYLVGFTDITPFLLNIFQGEYALGTSVLVATCIRAMMSNNIVNFFYSMTFSGNRKTLRKYLLIGFGAITTANILALFIN
jgi:uncharacterized membrane protein (DUF4010 family)